MDRDINMAGPPSKSSIWENADIHLHSRSSQNIDSTSPNTEISQIDMIDQIDQIDELANSPPKSMVSTEKSINLSNSSISSINIDEIDLNSTMIVEQKRKKDNELEWIEKKGARSTNHQPPSFIVPYHIRLLRSPRAFIWASIEPKHSQIECVIAPSVLEESPAASAKIFPTKTTRHEKILPPIS